MFYLDKGICKKPSLNESEDIVGNNKGYYWLLDGATPPLGELTHEHTRLFVTEMNKALFRYSTEANNSEELLEKAIENVTIVFKNMGLDKYDYQPYSTAIVSHIVEDSIEYIVLGDSVLGIQINEEVKIITDDRLKHVANKERDYVRKLRAEGIDEKSKQYLNARTKLIMAEKQTQNIEGGYWVAGFCQEAIKHAVKGRVKINNQDECMIILLSDGLERLVSVFKQYQNVCKIGEAILKCGKETVFSQLRELESNKNNFLNPVSSMNDDASYIIITNDYWNNRYKA